MNALYKQRNGPLTSDKLQPAIGETKLDPAGRHKYLFNMNPAAKSILVGFARQAELAIVSGIPIVCFIC
jgi:hypothetical protein